MEKSFRGVEIPAERVSFPPLPRTQPRGVTVAQVVLVHLVKVRILAGLPFFPEELGSGGGQGAPPPSVSLCVRYALFSSRMAAVAAIPSSLPQKPIPSVVVALTETADVSVCKAVASFSLIAGI